MPELVSKREKDWTIEVKCKGTYGCGYTYRYTEHDVEVDSFKVSGYFFDGSDKCADKAYVYCGNCKRLLFVQPPMRIMRSASRP